jgi:RNA polymerase sigma-54 factor
VLLQNDQRQVITQRIDPKIIMANSILQLTSMELVQSIESEVADNPALDTLDDTPCAGDCIDPANCPYCSARRLRDAEADPRSETPDSGDQETEYELFGFQAAEAEDEYDFVANLEAEMTFQEHLRGLMRNLVRAEEYWIAEYLISNLTERGWLDGNPEEMAAEMNIPASDVCRVLAILQTCDPPGVGARNLQECLTIQLRYLLEENIDADKRHLIVYAEKMVHEHFDHVIAQRHIKLARAVGCTPDEAKQVLAYIAARLNPSPASQFHPPWSYRPTNSKSSVRPDVQVRRTEVGYEVEVGGADTFSLCVNPVYREAYAQIKSGRGHFTDEDRKHIIEHVERAEMFIRNINQRRQSLRAITHCIIDYQIGFLETGSRQFLRPLTRTQIARQLDYHESTVSRATANKFIQLPNQEVVSFNLFFNSSLSVKDAIREIIEVEDPVHPVSDQQIVTLLLEKGIHIQRRTVVKYREHLKILSSTRRRR